MLAATLLLLTALQGAGPDDTAALFRSEVRPLLASRCFACHGNDEETREAGLRLDTRAAATADRGGYAAIVPGDAESSEIWWRVIDDVDPMPPEHAGAPLSPEELDVLRRWIDGGAEYAQHWAFVAPERPAVPPGHGNAVDAFIAERLGAVGLELSERADDATLLRRLSLDLTGLPPTPEEVRAFVRSEDPGKVDAAIERFLASPAYAERWAAMWLDIARYADSSGHGSDPLRTIWRYRDWVIEAYHRNLPYDEFVRQQIAGDLLPEADDETRLATAFHRNTMTNTEGGTDDEEFRVLAVKDRVGTTLQAFMGLTASCAECHSHKYDPISHVEYYQLFDIFNQTADRDRDDDAPRLPTPTRAQRPEWERIGAELARVDAALAERRAVLGAGDDEVLSFALARVWSTERPTALAATSVRAGAGETVRALGDGSVLVTGSGERGARSVSIPAAAAPPRSLVVEAIRHASLPRSGPGLSSASGNFVLSQLSVRARRADGPASVPARTVRIELPGSERILSLAEVELLGIDGAPIAGERVARQSSTDYDGPAERAIDGNTDGAYDSGSVTHTRTSDDPWWEVELARATDLGSVRVWSRTDGDLEQRLHGFRVVVLDDAGDEVWRSALAPAPSPALEVGPAVGEPLWLTVGGVTHEQPRFEARRAVDGISSSADGWAVGGGEGRDHVAVFALPELAGPAHLEVDLQHTFGGDHVLACFRVSADTSDELPAALGADVRALISKPLGERSADDVRRVSEALTGLDPEALSLRRRRETLFAEREALGVVTTPVMVELGPDARRATHVLVRGNFLQPGERVQAAVPAAFGALPEGRPADRLALADWLVAPENPLTARVHVNRLWARLFGRGLVATEEDFGNQGEHPTHPGLLDWLAVEFRENGWDQKALLRSIVTSRAYQQSSGTDAERLALDPDAALLSRYPRQRLEAEMVRDAALRVAGLLSMERFGPSVFPPQPAGLWQAAFNGQRDWMESTGGDRYRRGLYVFLRRTIPYPMLSTFDAPSRETCTVRRIATNTPLQVFVTLNDPVFVEAAQAFGRELARVAGASSDAAAIEDGGLRALGRPLSAVQAAELLMLLRDARTEFAADPEGARAFATDPLGPLPAGLAPADGAAWSLVASALLNLDAFLTKE